MIQVNGDFHNCAVGKCIIAANLGAVLIDQVKPFDAVVDTGAKQFHFHMSFVVLLDGLKDFRGKAFADPAR